MSRAVNQVFDEMLVLYAIEGRREAFDRLARRWRPRHYAHACRLLGRKELAADAVQDAWINIVRGLHRLDDPARFPAWSYAIVTHRCQDLLRRSYRARESEIDESLAADETPSALAAHDLRRGLQTLPSEQRIAIALFYSDGFTIAEISEVLSIPEGTVKTRLFHARRTLRQYFGGEANE